MPHYSITITNDTTQQIVISANSVVEALDKAKKTFTEDMVTGTEQEIRSSSYIQVRQPTKPKIHIPVVTKAENDANNRIRIEDIPD